MPRTRNIADVRQELAAKVKQLGKLRRERETLQKRLDSLDRQIAALGGRGMAGRRKTRKAGRPARRGGRPEKPLTGYLVDLLRKAKRGVRSQDLTAAVLRAGYVTRDRNFKQTVASMLGSDGRFKRVRRGVYKLAARGAE